MEKPTGSSAGNTKQNYSSLTFEVFEQILLKFEQTNESSPRFWSKPAPSILRESRSAFREQPTHDFEYVLVKILRDFSVFSRRFLVQIELSIFKETRLI